MGKLLNAAKAHVGITAAGAVLLLGGGVATAAVVVTPAASTEDVYELPATATTEPTPTTEAPPALVPVPAPVVAEPPVVAELPVEPAPLPQADTVQGVTEPAPETIPAPQVNPDGSLPEGWQPPLNPGEPPIAPVQPPASSPKLPGEPGYTGTESLPVTG